MCVQACERRAYFKAELEALQTKLDMAVSGLRSIGDYTDNEETSIAVDNILNTLGYK